MASFSNDPRSFELAFCASPALPRIPHPSFARSPTGIASGPQSLCVILLDGALSLPLVLRNDFEGKEEVVKYTVSLANPLSYTRGTFVPVHLEIACENLRLLEALFKRECHNIHLVCEIAALLRPKGEMPKYLKALAAQPSNKDDSPSKTRAYAFPSERISGAVKIMSDVCFPDDAPIYRHLEKSWPSVTLKGEIHLSRSLLPSSEFVSFSARYKVQINPPSDVSRRFISPPIAGASAPVTVATQFALDVERPVKMLRGHSLSRREIKLVVEPTSGVLNRSLNTGSTWVSQIS